MSNGLLFTAAVLLVVTAFAHSVLGERRLIGPMLARREGVLASDLVCVILRFAWHLTSVTWVVLALILVQLVRNPATARVWAAAGTGVAFTGIGLFDAVASRGRMSAGRCSLESLSRRCCRSGTEPPVGQPSQESGPNEKTPRPRSTSELRGRPPQAG
jgi:hypothetical protein